MSGLKYTPERARKAAQRYVLQKTQRKESNSFGKKAFIICLIALILCFAYKKISEPSFSEEEKAEFCQQISVMIYDIPYKSLIGKWDVNDYTFNGKNYDLHFEGRQSYNSSFYFAVTDINVAIFPKTENKETKNRKSICEIEYIAIPRKDGETFVLEEVEALKKKLRAHDNPYNDTDTYGAPLH